MSGAALRVLEHDASGALVSEVARVSSPGAPASSLADATTREGGAPFGAGSLGAREGEVCALRTSSPAALVGALDELLRAGAVPLVLPPGLPPARALDLATRAGAALLVEDDGAALVSRRLPSAGALTLAFAGYLTCTSGTTGGEPRVYAFRLSVARENARAHLESIGASDARAIALPMPLAHSFGLVAGWLAAEVSGATLVAFRDTPDPLTLLRVVAEREVDTLALTPPLARLLLKAARRRAPSIPGSLRRVSVGSAAMGAPELLALRALFPDAELYFTYGQTELGPRVSTLRVEPETLASEGPVTLGAPLRGVTMHVSQGSLHVRSPYMAAGQLSGGGLTGLCAQPHGFFDTRDAARELPGGSAESPQVTLLGRLDGVIVRGGTNVYPEDVEAAALSCPGVVAAACVPDASPMYGQVPVLLCELSPDAPAWEQLEPALRAHLSAVLPSTSVPVALHPLATLPRGPLGKVLRADALSLFRARDDAGRGTSP